MAKPKPFKEGSVAILGIVIGVERRSPIDRLISADRIQDRLVERWPCFVHGSLDPFEAPALNLIRLKKTEGASGITETT